MNVSALQQPGQSTQTFEDRRNRSGEARPDGMPERRQFRDARNDANPGAAELGDAIDKYKSENRRRFITWDELYNVILDLGYEKKR
ncbi:MAG: hypothetical protein HQ518_21310 [Rhodopirellula sp.]|nr:hypothetical protein [Rhodopirellula sp.]